MAALSSDNIFLHDGENKVNKSRGQSTFKVHHGMSRKVAIIASIQQRKELKNKISAPKKENNKTFCLKEFFPLDDEIENYDFSHIGWDIPESEALPELQDHFQEYQESISTKLGPLAIHLVPEKVSPKKYMNLHKVLTTYEAQVPRMAIVLPRPHQGLKVSKLENLESFRGRINGPSKNENIISEQLRRTKLLSDKLRKFRLLSKRDRNQGYCILSLLIFLFVMFTFYLIMTTPHHLKVFLHFARIYFLIILYIVFTSI